jgi:flagellar hook-associated protein 1 FlgK
MLSTFSGIELGKKGLITHQAAINVTGHNVTNAETEGYSRQKVSLEVFDPLYIPGLTRENTPGQIGQGVQIEKILRARDMLLEDRILSEKNGLSYWKTLSDWIYQVELIHNEPSDKSIMHVLDKFWASWQDLANNPEELGSREAVRENGGALARHINYNFQALRALRDNVERAIEMRTEEINDLARQIAKLNEEILRSESTGDNPNDLWDKRDLLVERLSGFVDIRIGRSDQDEFIVFIGGKHLVQGKHFEQLMLERNPDNEGYSDIHWKVDGSLLNLRSGELKALLDTRDVEVKYQIDALDAFATSLMDLVNSMHRRGFGLNLRTGLNFFIDKPISANLLGDYDFDRDGFVDGTAVFRIAGNGIVDVEDVVGLQGTITLNDGVSVDYTRTDTVADIVTRVNNAGADVKFFINGEGKLVVKSDMPRLAISHLEDSGDFLVGYSGVLEASGGEGSFDSSEAGMAAAISGEFMITPFIHPSSWISLDDRIANEVESIAASAGTDTDGDGIPDLSMGAGNGDNALSIAGIRSIIAGTGLRGEAAQGENENRDLIVENLTNLRKSISGVNIDEELVNLVKFQHGYAAAARFITKVDEMLDLLINRMM